MEKGEGEEGEEEEDNGEGEEGEEEGRRGEERRGEGSLEWINRLID